MAELTDKQIAEYFKRSYRAADGLWFMKVEERYGFESALDIDQEVWKVLPKIQARIIKSMLNAKGGLDDLEKCTRVRLDLEEHGFQAERHGNVLEIFITRCPWRDLMVKSGREHLSQKVSSIICTEENSVWASEFGDISFEPGERICDGKESCRFRFIDRSSV